MEYLLTELYQHPGVDLAHQQHSSTWETFEATFLADMAVEELGHIPVFEIETADIEIGEIGLPYNHDLRALIT